MPYANSSGPTSICSKLTPFFAGLTGAFVGACISWMVNVSLIEISLNPVFTVYFGSLFTLFGAIIVYKIYTPDANSSPIPNTSSYHRHRNLNSSGGNSFLSRFYALSWSQMTTRQRSLLIFGCLVILSGLACFILDEEWFRWSYLMKIPFYALLGTALTFSLVFSIIDIINVAVQSSELDMRGYVYSPMQIYIILVSSTLMGIIFGCLFGLLDIEDSTRFTIRMNIIRDEMLCLPGAVVIGGISGAVIDVLRSSPGTSTNSGNGYRQTSSNFSTNDIRADDHVTFDPSVNSRTTLFNHDSNL
eukprot:g2780.t1